MPELVAKRSTAMDRLSRYELLSFVLAGDLFAVQLSQVTEILNARPVTRVPRAPKEFDGVCSVRGLLVTVLDLRTRIGLPRAEPTRRTRLLLVGGEEDERIALVVDEVRQVVRLSEAQLEPALDVFGSDVSEHIAAVGRPDRDTVLVLLDLAALLRVRRRAGHDDGEAKA